ALPTGIDDNSRAHLLDLTVFFLDACAYRFSSFPLLGRGGEAVLPSPRRGRGVGGEAILPSPRRGRGVGGEGVSLEKHLQYPRAFMNIHTLFLSIAQHHQVEFAADDLPGLGAFV